MAPPPLALVVSCKLQGLLGGWTCDSLLGLWGQGPPQAQDTLLPIPPTRFLCLASMLGILGQHCPEFREVPVRGASVARFSYTQQAIGLSAERHRPAFSFPAPFVVIR